jgi:hypothetical protein
VFKDLIRKIVNDKLVFRAVTAAPKKVFVGRSWLSTTGWDSSGHDHCRDPTAGTKITVRARASFLQEGLCSQRRDARAGRRAPTSTAVEAA